MTQPFTASEVRDTVNRMAGGGSAIHMLHAYADRLEADEKAVPVYQHRNKSGPLIRWFDCDAETYEFMERNEHDREHFDRRILYTHPAPADTERLAEALWQAMQSLRTIERGAMREGYLGDEWNVRAYARSRANVAGDVLATHSAQAQPPTAGAPAETCERPPECANGCPEFQVCDYCQRPHRAGADTVRLTEALRVIRQHLAGDPSATAASIIATIDTALADRPSESRPPAVADEYIVVKADPDSAMIHAAMDWYQRDAIGQDLAVTVVCMWKAMLAASPLRALLHPAEHSAAATALLTQDTPSWRAASENWPSLHDPGEHIRHHVMDTDMLPYGALVTVGDRLRIHPDYFEKLKADLPR